MKVRKLAVALALAGGMGSNLVYALGLGDAEIKSNLNEPLRAEIDLVGTNGLTRDEIIASLAPERDFRKVGVEPIFFLSEIQFDVVKNNRGELVLQLTTNKPVREPYLNFLVEVAWPSGRLLREYALLIDPPIFRDGNPEPQPQIAATASEPAAERPRARSQAQPAQQRSASSSPSPSPSSSSNQGASAPGERVVSSSDTLWNIAREVRPADDLTPQQVMLALQDANPDAFLRSNINLVREGSVLRIPSEDAMRSRTRREAVQQVTAQNRIFQQGGRSAQEVAIDGAGERPGSAAERASQPAEPGDELRLLASDGSGTDDGSHGGDMGGSGSGNAESRLATTLEELDRSKRENEELNSRVGDLQEQLANMQRLIELKNDRLAALQAEQVAAAQQPEEISGSESSAEPSAQSLAVAPGSANDSPGGDGSAGSSPDGGTGPEGAGETGVPDAQSPNAGESEGMTDPAATAAEGPSLVSGADQSQEPAASAPAQSEPAGRTADAGAEPQSAPQADWSVAGIIKMVRDNPLYQIIAGGVAVGLLGLLWLLARRGSKREEDFYAQLEQEESDYDVSGGQAGGGAFAAGLAAAGVTDDVAGPDEQHRDESRHLAGGGADADTDAAAEADAYMAYGRLDKAAEVLEKAITEEPGRTDLRLKALEVYADNGDEEGFARHMGELEGFDDEAALTKGEALRERLAARSGALSIDDLESQLRGDVGRVDEAGKSSADEDDDLGIDWTLDDEPTGQSGKTEDEALLSSEFDFDSELEQFNSELESEKDLSNADDEDRGIDFRFDESELEDGQAEQDRKPADADDMTAKNPDAEEPDADDLGFDFSLDEDELDAAADEDKGADLSDEDLDELDLGDDLEDDLQSLEAAQLKEAKAEHQTSSPEPLEDSEVPAAFDDSFLDELDAELDKVGEDEPDVASATEEAADTADGELDDVLDDLELDVSDEDLALIEEVAGGDELQELEVDDLDDLSADAAGVSGTDSWKAASEGDGGAAIPHLDPADVDGEIAEFDDSLLDVDESENPSSGFSENDLGDEDDFDFLDGTDEAATKLDLARAYVEMGDSDGARDILGEVALEGSDSQKREAETLLRGLA